MTYTYTDYKMALLTLKKSVNQQEIKAAQEIIKAYKEQQKK